MGREEERYGKERKKIRKGREGEIRKGKGKEEKIK